MTNETTASQPKSIGDDAQFIDLLGDFAYARREGSFDQKRAARQNLVAYLDGKLRAPAAQSSATIYAECCDTPSYCSSVRRCTAKDSATIQAAPSDLAGWFVYEEGAWVATSSDWPGATKLYRAATIQEPVMVAEPVGVLPILDMWVDPKTKLRSILDHGTLLSPSDRREFVGSLVWSTDPQDAPLDPENLSLRPAPPTVAEPVGRDGRMSDELRKMIEGMSVSVDVSTGDDDAGNRYFGTVNEVMDGYHGEKHGVMLLIQDPEPNFDLSATVKAVPSEALDPSEVQTIAERIRNSNFAAPLADKTDGGE